MKTKFFFLATFLAITFFANAQTCTEMFEFAKEAEKQGNFADAYMRYDAALYKCGEEMGEAMCKKIEHKKNEMMQKLKKQKEQINNALAEVKRQKAKTDAALAEVKRQKAKADKVINSLYFYKDSFALACKDFDGTKRYGFIDKKGNVKISYVFEFALPFVNIENLTNLIILSLENSKLSSLPAEMGQLTNLTTLDLSSNQLTSLPAEMGQLTNLTVFI